MRGNVGQPETLGGLYEVLVHTPAMHHVADGVGEVPGRRREARAVPAFEGVEHGGKFMADDAFGIDAVLAAADVEQAQDSFFFKWSGQLGPPLDEAGGFLVFGVRMEAEQARSCGSR